MSSKPATLRNAVKGKTHNAVMVRVPSSVIINAKSDSRNIEYLISYLQKISLEQVVFE